MQVCEAGMRSDWVSLYSGLWSMSKRGATHLFKYLLDVVEEAILRRKWQWPAFAGVLITGR